MKDSFDKKMKKMAASDRPQTPQRIKDAAETLLEALPERKPGQTGQKRAVRMGIGFAAAFVLTFVLLPNLSAEAAQAMEQLPVLGLFLRAVTVREYFYEDERHELDVRQPEIEGDGLVQAGEINESILELTDRILEQFYEDTGMLRSENYQSLQMDYETVTDNDSWFTLKLAVTETAASSSRYYRFYHIDKKTGEIVRFADLFNAESGYRDAISKEIRRQMEEQMETEEGTVYWLDSELAEAEFTSVAEDQNFYWNGEGDLVIVFDQYEVGPGFMGCPEFVIPKEVYEIYEIDQTAAP